MIDGSTKKVGVMGWPISHTLSPFMHNAAFAASGLNYAYLPFAVKPEDLGKAVAGLQALGFSGMNVTIPHKVNIMQYLDRIEPSARIIGAVNTIVAQEGKLIGCNTDADGFIASLKEQGVNPQGANALILGAGGAARAVVCGLISQGIRSLVVVARDKLKAIGFAADFRRLAQINPICFTDVNYADAHKAADLVINCTPLGVSPKVDAVPPVIWEALHKDAIICDLVYIPLETRFMAEAKQRGHKTIGGLGMLIEQGAIAFEKWTGVKAPREIMAKAAKDKLC